MDGSDFKELLAQMTSAGAGRPVGKDGIPTGPWTPELLADAISQINSNGTGVDLRTVQHWFEKNDKGISAQNIRWLAHIFGCGDPEATSAWQAELSASRLRFIAKRRASATANLSTESPHAIHEANSIPRDGLFTQASNLASAARAHPQTKPSLALRTEKLFSNSPLNMPAAVFACAVALGFMSILLGNHDVIHSGVGAPSKQVGFIWAPNWTLLFWIFMPLFLGTVAELVIFWREEGRLALRPSSPMNDREYDWLRRVDASKIFFWTVFLICTGFAGVMQWVGKRLQPLLTNGHDYATDWGTIAIERPDIISIPVSIVFTGFAYLYMCICFYLFFAGLILLYSMVQEFKVWRHDTHVALRRRFVTAARNRVMQGLFRSVLLGILIALCMKLQSYYLISTAPDILSWLLNDVASALGQNSPNTYAEGYKTPKQFSSLLIVLACCFVFFSGTAHLSSRKFEAQKWTMQRAVVLLLVFCYLTINAFVGFTILLAIGLALAVYGILDSGWGMERIMEEEPVRNA